MSVPLVALALSAMCAVFAAAASDTAQVIGLRNTAADEARRVTALTLDGCSLGSGVKRHCAPPPSCASPGCSVCWDDGSVRADVVLEWSPAVLRGLAPARGRHALTLETLDVADLAGATLPACASAQPE